MVFQDRLVVVKKEVEQGLVAFFAKKRQEAKQISPHCLMLVDSVAEFTMRGGKRTRAFLCWLGHHTVIARSEATRQSLEIASPSEWTRNDKLLSAMMALELFQSFALIHDDIIDEDTVRRGGPTVHEHFKSQITNPNVQKRQRYGESMAILAGDLALVWADELMGEAVRLSLRAERSNLSIREIATSPTAPRNDINIWNLYQRMKEEVILGQSLDVLASIGLPSADRETINRYKTAWYSVIRPIQIGAAIGGADTDTLEAYVPYGLAVGQAYQLRDDFLDGAVRKDVFVKKARKLQERATQAIKKLKISKSVTILLADFAHFTLHRST
ncbi:MAG: polyprenyl synthetase family protein [Patescibacteria group bacterium]